MFGFSRDEMRPVGGGPEPRPTSTTTTSSGLVSPPYHPASSPDNLPSELEGANHAAVLEWQQAQAASPQPGDGSHHQTNGTSNTLSQTRIDADPTQAPILYPEPDQVPTRPTSTIPPSALHQHAHSPPPLPTPAQSQWLAQQSQQQQANQLNIHAQGSSVHSPSPSHASMQPGVQQPEDYGMQHYAQGIEHQHQDNTLSAAHPYVSGGVQPAGSPAPQHVYGQPVQNPSPAPTPANIHAQPQQANSLPPAHQVVIDASGQQVIRPTTPAASMHNMQQQHPTTQPNLPPGYVVINGQVVVQPAQGASTSYPQQPVAHDPSVTLQASSVPTQLVAQQPSQPQMFVNQAQGQYTMQQSQSAQHQLHPTAQPATKPSKTKWKPSKKPAPTHRPSVSTMSVASSVSSVSTDTGPATQPISPQAYNQVFQQPQLQVQMQVQSMPQHQPQHVSMTAGHPVSYPWKCGSCGVGLSPKNVYHECLICSSADLASKLCQTCYIHGANSNSLSFGHDATYYICNQDPVLSDPNVPPQKWTVKQNQFGRRWYQSCTQPVKTHIQPMTATIPNHSGWIEAKTKQGNEMKIFWVNAVTGETSWQRPPTGMPKGWREVRTPEGKPFYMHDALELATWVYPGHQPGNPAPAPQQPLNTYTASVQAQVPVQTQVVNPQIAKPPTSPQVIHAPQPVRRAVNGTGPIQTPAPQANLQGQVQVNVGRSLPQQAPQKQVLQHAVSQPQSLQQQTAPQQQQQQKAAQKELKSAGKQLGVAAAGGVMTAGLRMFGVSPQQASAMANGVINVGKAGINVRRASKPQVQQQSPSGQPTRPILQATYSSDGSDSSQVLLTPQSPAVAGVGMQQQSQGQYFVNVQGRAIQPQKHHPHQYQPTHVPNIHHTHHTHHVEHGQGNEQEQSGSSSDGTDDGSAQNGDPGQAGSADPAVGDDSNVTGSDPTQAQDSSSYVVNGLVGSPSSLYASPQDDGSGGFAATTTTTDGSYVTTTDGTYVTTTDGSYVATTSTTVDTSTYVDVTAVSQSQYVVATDSAGFASTATGPVPTDLGSYGGDSFVGMDQQQTSMAVTSLDASYAYDSMAQTGQENALGLIDGTTYEEVTVDDSGGALDFC